MLNPDLDFDRLAEDYARDQRCRVANVLKDDVAHRLASILSSQVAFELAYVIDGQNLLISMEELAALTPE